MTAPIGVWTELVGQEPALETLSSAASAAAKIVAGEPVAPAAMTHAWLLTGPPGSGRSVAARTFAAALQCSTGTGCGACPGCRTTMAGTHADVRLVVPEGLSISVAEMRALVQAAWSVSEGAAAAVPAGTAASSERAASPVAIRRCMRFP